MSHDTQKPEGCHPYEDLLSTGPLTRLSDMYRDVGNTRMANKVSMYEAALGGELRVYRINRPGCSVDLYFIREREFLGHMVACDVGVGDLDAAVDSALGTLCAKHGVHETELKMKLDLMGD